MGRCVWVKSVWLYVWCYSYSIWFFLNRVCYANVSFLFFLLYTINIPIPLISYLSTIPNELCHVPGYCGISSPFSLPLTAPFPQCLPSLALIWTHCYFTLLYYLLLHTMGLNFSIKCSSPDLPIPLSVHISEQVIAYIEWNVY